MDKHIEPWHLIVVFFFALAMLAFLHSSWWWLAFGIFAFFGLIINLDN